MKIRHYIVSFLVYVLLGGTWLFSQTVNFIPAGKVNGYVKYNVTVKNASGNDGAGGFKIDGDSFTASTNYFVQVSFDNGSTWHYIENAFATLGTWIGSGMFKSDANGEFFVEFSHARLTSLAAWPGNNGTINCRLTNQAGTVYYPGAAGSAFTLDLELPTISTASITSDNDDQAWAIAGDVITISFTSSENLSTDSEYPISGDISGVNINSSGSGTSWTASNTVSTHAEGAATFDISFYDVNENLGGTSLSTTTDGSSVTIDVTTPVITTSIVSNNSTNTLAKANDVVTLSIASTELLKTAPTVTIDGNNITPNPNTSASSYTVTRTMVDGDTQGSVAFVVSNIKDRAGNQASNQTSASDGTNVTFDSVDPTLSSVTIASNNAISSSLAKPDDIVTLTFYTSEKSQVPDVTIAGENATEANDNGDQLTWTATKTMDPEDADGTVAFTIDFYDLAGNQGTQATAVTSGGTITFDKTAPATNTITVASSNSNATLAKTGDVITVTVVASENLQTDDDLTPWGISSASIAGQSIAASNISTSTATNWEISYTLTGAESDGSAGYAFTLADAAGNTTDVSSAGSTVAIDNTKPTLTLVNIESNNANSSYAKEGDVITLTLTSSEDLIGNPTIFLAGRSATVAAVGGSATNYTASLTTNNTDTQGNVAISIAFSDLAGNAGDAVIATTNSSSVFYDRTVPTLSAVTMASNNANTAYAKEGDIVTISFTTSENIQDTDDASPPAATIGGETATVSGSGTSWSAAYTMQDGDTEGDLAFTLDFTDIAGNSGSRVTTLTSGSLVKYDETIPTLTTVDIASNNSNGATLAKVGDVITVSITASENIQTPTVTISGEAATIATGNNGESVFTATYTMQSSDNTGTIPFTVDFSDLANNDGAQATATVNDADGNVTFDKQAPAFSTVTIISNNSNNTALAIVNDVITLNLTSDENIKTGSDPTITINGNNTTITRNSATSFTATYSMSSPADDAIDGSSIPINISAYTDATGNVGATVTATTDGSAVTYDNTLPTLGTVTISSDNTYDWLAKVDDKISLSIASSENINTPTVSMLGSTADVTVTQGATASSWTAEKTVTGGHGDGTAVFSITYTDIAGNSGAAVTALTGGDDAVTIDKTAPTITTASIASNNSSGDEFAVPGNIITLTVVSNEDITEPTITIATQNADVSQGSDAQNWTATYTMTENETGGTIPFSIAFSDSAGNDGTDVTALVNDADGNAVNYDKSQPVLSNVTLISDNAFNSAYAKSGSVVTLSFDANEELSTSSVVITINGVNRTPSKSLSWDGTKESWVATYTMTDATDDNGGAGYSVPFTVDYVDLNGYAGDQVTATSSGVGVTFDKTAPSILTLSYSSNNSNLSSRAKVGDVISVDITGSEALQTPVLSIAGNDVANETAGGTDAIWTGSYTMQNTDSDGEIGLSLDYKDYAGNSGTTSTSTTDGTTVTFDRTLPTLTTVTLTSNNRYNSSKAKVNDIVTLTIVADESLISDPTFTIAGQAVTPTGSGANWAGTYNLQTGDTEGDVTFSIAFFDQAANAGVTVTATTDGGAVTFDKTATNLAGLAADLLASSDTGVDDEDNLTNDTTPTFSITGLTAINAIGDSIFLVIDEDTVSRQKVGANSINFTSTALTNQALPYEATILCRDPSGNMSAPTTALKFRIDTQAPATGNIINLIAEDDSGFSTTDDITKVTSPRLEVSGLAAGKKDSIRISYDAQAGLSDIIIGEYRMSQAVIDTLLIPSILTDDRYTFTYFVIDSAGNTSSESAGMNVFIDATSPVTPSNPDLLAAYDSGTSNTDDITNLSDIAFNVSNLVAEDSLYILNGGGDIVASELLAGSSSNPTVFGATVGTDTYAAYTKDPAGNVSITSGTISVTIDQTPTVVTGVSIDLDAGSDSGILNNDNITNVTNPTILISGLTVTDSVLVYVNDAIDQRALVTSTTYSYAINNTLSDNIHELKIKAKDYAGNLSVFSPSLNIKVDTTPYTITTVPDLLPDDDSGIASDDNITSNREPRFEMAGLSSIKDSIRLFINDGVSNQFLIGGRKGLDKLKDTLKVPTSSRLDEGTYDLTYVVIDSAGNTSTVSSATSIVVDFTPPNAPSAPDLSSSDDTGNSDTDDLTKATSMDMTVTGLTEGDFGLLYKVDEASNTTLVDSVIVGSGGSLTYSVSNGADGEFDFHAVSIDTAGNISTNSLTTTITVDQTRPNVAGATINLDDASDSGIKNDDDLTNDTSPSFTINGVTATDSIFLYFSDVQNQKDLASGATVNFTGDVTTDGEYEITIKAKDEAGNISPASPALTFRLDTTPFVPTTAPDLMAELDGVVYDTGISNSDDTTSARQPRFEISGLPSVADSLHLFSQSGINNVLVQKTRKTYNVTKDTLLVPPASELGTGSYVITYTIIDSAGNVSVPSDPLTIYVDFTAPNAPDLSDLITEYDTGEQNDDNITNLNTINISPKNIQKGYSGLLYGYDAADPAGSLALVDSQLVGDSDLIFTTTNAVEGTYAYYSVSVDSAGNRSPNSDILSIVLDQTAPDVSAVTIDLDDASDTGIKNDDNLSSDTLPSFTVAGVTATDSIFLFYDGIQKNKLKASGASVNFAGNTVTVDGSYLTTIKAKDLAGNLSSSSSSITYRLDTTPFTTTSAPNLLNDYDSGFSSSDDTTKIREPQFEISQLPAVADSLHLFVKSGINNELVYKARKTYNVFKDTLLVPNESELGTGKYTITYTVIDSAGNVSAPSDSLIIHVDFTAPSAPGEPILSDASDFGESDSDKITNDERPTVILTDILPGYLGELYVYDAATDTYAKTGDTQLLDTSTMESLTYQVPTFETGIYQYAAVHIDTAGNVSGYGPLLTINVDRTDPTAQISFDGDSLVRAGDLTTLATFTFSESMDSVTVPSININYPGVADSLDLFSQSLTKGANDSIWTYSIPLNSTGLDTVDGNVEITVNASDIAGNPIPSGNITGLTTLRIDNTSAVFSEITPASRTFNNVLNTFGWTLSESIDSGHVEFKNQKDGTTSIVPLDSIENLVGPKTPSAFLLGDPPITEGIFDLIYTSIDTAGNIGRDTISNYTYDTTSATGIITFQELFASGGQTDTITVTFNEKMLPTPIINIEFPSDFVNDIDTMMTLYDDGDSTKWFYVLNVPDVIEGQVGISITANDLATNAIDADSLSMPDTLFIDNTEAIATFSYSNLSNPGLSNIGIGGDTIQVTISMNEPLESAEPVPTLDYTYGWGDTLVSTTIAGQVPQSTTNGDSIWIFEVILSDSVYDDGPINFELIAEDRSNNLVTDQQDSDIFIVDNRPPAAFETGQITVYSPNSVEGWITGITDSIGVQIPIESFEDDPTLFLGGYVQLQFWNLNRGTEWVTPAPDDSLIESGIVEFFRDIDALFALMPPGSGILTGDSLRVRAKVVDRHGNVTYGTESSTRLGYDPTPPTIGTITGGSFTDADTLFSSDYLSIDWEGFEDLTDEDESGIDRYEVAILKIDAVADTGAIYDGWDTVALDVTNWSKELFLEHDNRYVGHIRAFDVAGNISDTLITDTLTRYNSNPVILNMDNAVLNEDLFWTDTVQLTDLDLDVMQGDSFRYSATTTRIIGDIATGSVTIDSIGAMTWIPTQDDTGTYEIEITVIDNYELEDTYVLPLTVNAVNDTPVFSIPNSGMNPYYVHEWVEDQPAKELVLSRYITDVDNDIVTEISWQAVIMDTSQLDEDYPLGQVVVGPKTPWDVHARLNRQYLGFNPNASASGLTNLSHETVQLINNTRTNPLISVEINPKQYGDGIPDSVVATFSSESNYYGDDHRIIFIAQDLGGAVVRDTIHASILPENDPPTIAKDMMDSIVYVLENDQIWLEFGQYVNDIDDTSLVFNISSVVDPEIDNDNKINIIPSVEHDVNDVDDVTFSSFNLGDSVLFIPEKLWDDHVVIKLKVTDQFASDSTTFLLDVQHVPRPRLSVSLLQQTAFTKFIQIVVVDTAMKTLDLSMDVQNQSIALDTIADYTYTGDIDFDTPGNYSIDIYATALVGDTTLSETFGLTIGRVASRWQGSSSDGRFSVVGNPGAITYDQPFIIADSNLFEPHFYDRASYVLGGEDFSFNNPVEIRFNSDRDDLAIYRRKNRVTWEELPSLQIENEIFTLSNQSGYFRLGPKTIIVPEQTNIHQNYPNPFNPNTTINYDIGLMDGLRQNVTIDVYNLLGQNIITLVKNKDQIGQFKIQWDGYDRYGQQMSSGVYFIQLTTKTGIVKNRKMMLLK